MVFLLVLAINVVLGFVAGAVWRHKGGGFRLGFLMGLIGGFVGLIYVLAAKPAE